MIYVSGLRPTTPQPVWPWKTGCWVFADTNEELFAAAEALGLPAYHVKVDEFGFGLLIVTRQRRAELIRMGASNSEKDIRRIIKARGEVRRSRLDAPSGETA